MPSNYKYERKIKWQSWLHENVRGAIDEVLKQAMGYMKASNEFGVPQSILEAQEKRKKWLYAKRSLQER
jgi:hypothetical protein